MKESVGRNSGNSFLAPNFHSAPNSFASASLSSSRSRRSCSSDSEHSFPALSSTGTRLQRHTCRRTKATHHVPYRTLRILLVPTQPWQHISVDFVTGLPPSQGYDAICVSADRLTKQRYLLPFTTTTTPEGLAKLVYDRIFHYHGPPETIVSDRGLQLAS